VIIDTTRLSVWDGAVKSLRSVVAAGLSANVTSSVVNALCALSTVAPRPPRSWRLAVIPPATVRRHVQVDVSLLSSGPGGTTFETRALVLKVPPSRIGTNGPNGRVCVTDTSPSWALKSRASAPLTNRACSNDSRCRCTRPPTARFPGCTP